MPAGAPKKKFRDYRRAYGIRFSPDEYKAAKAIAAANGEIWSQYVRRVCLGLPLQPKPKGRKNA